MSSSTLNRSRNRAFSLFPIVLAASVVTGGAMVAYGGAGIDTFIGEPGDGSAIDSPQANPESDAASDPSAGDLSSNKEPAVVLGTASMSSSADNENRAGNLAVAASAIDGLSILPGETFSLNDVLGNYNASLSYSRAPEDSSDQSPQLRGGGTSQVASALYVAAVRANLEVVERHAHEKPVDYAAIGFDAEISYRKQDLKLRNTGLEPLSIHSIARGQMVTIEVLGQQRKDGKTFDLVAAVANDDDLLDESSSVEHVGVSDADAETLAAQETVTIASYKVTMLDGTRQSEKLLFIDTYHTGSQPFTTEKGFAGIAK